MKTPITLTILRGMPDVAWQRASIFLRDGSVEYTPVQAPAATCWRYYVAMHTSGLDGFASLYSQADKDELDRAFGALGIGEIVDHLVMLAQSRGQAEGQAAEDWFEENARDWAMAVWGYVQDYADEFFEIVDEDYEVAPGSAVTVISGIMAAVVLGFMTIIALTQTIVIYSLFFLLFLAIASPFIALVLYGLFWKIKVKKDVLTVRRPLRRRRVLPIDEITRARLRHNRLIIYTRGRRLVVRREVSYYSMLITQLSLAGKIDKAVSSDFTVRQQKANIITALLWPAAAGVFLAESLLRKINPAGVHEIAFLLALVVATLFYVAFVPWRRIVINDYFLTVVKMLGNEKAYPIPSVTRVKIQRDSMTLFAGKKKIAVVAFRCVGSPELLRRLREKEPGIAFEQQVKR